MKTIAYLVLCHAADEQLELLCNTLAQDPRVHVYVHLDNKAEVNSEIKINKESLLDVTFISNRCQVNWGGFSVVDATLRLLRTALQEKSYEHFVLLSGSCFPIESPEDTNNRIEEINEGLFSIWGMIDPNLKSSEGFGRYVVSKFQPYDWNSINPKKSIFHERAWLLYKKIAAYIPWERRISIEGLWKGSQFFVAGRDAAIYLAQDERVLKRSLKYALAPDEIYFNTLFVRYLKSKGLEQNYSDANQIEQGTHFIYKRVPSSRTLRQKVMEKIDLRRLVEQDIATVRKSKALFTRKCTPNISRIIARDWSSAGD